MHSVGGFFDSVGALRSIHANRMAEIKPFCRRDTRANHLRKSKTTYGIVLPTFQGRIVNHNRPKRC
nr:MAG TPA: GLUCOSE-6-PHOSPHATE 1-DEHYDROGENASE [Caudoviricetes sp.]